MISYLRPEDEVWDVPVVVLCVWTVVFLVSSLILLACLSRETKKFNKRLARANNKLENVQDIQYLDSLMARYVRSKLGLGVLATMANSFDNNPEEGQAENIRSDIEGWFRQRTTELRSMAYQDKQIRRTILAAIRAGLTKHPLDLRGSRRSLEAARIFLDLEDNKEDSRKVSFLQTSISVARRSPSPKGMVCPTIACDWVAASTLKFLSLLVSHPNTGPLIFTLLSFAVWLFDTVTDLVIIDQLWNFRLPILYPTNDSAVGEITYLSYQTLTIDLYAPLLLMFLLFSLLFTLLSCSCSRLSDKYRLSCEQGRPEREIPGPPDQDPTTLLARYDFNISSAITSSLTQFTLQFASYTIILYMLETLKGLSVDQATKEHIETKIEQFSFSSLWFSGVGSGVALVVAQYSAFKIQREHDLTLRQRFVYLMSCVLNTVSMMCSTLMLVVVVLLPAATFVGRYHIMAIVILAAVVLGIGFLMSLGLAAFGLDSCSIRTDRIHTVQNVDGLLTSYLRFSQTGDGKWRIMLGATTLVGRLFSLITINLFIPPSQMLIHPFLRFYSTSPRSPALHYTIAKQVVYYNILTLLSSILLCVDINEFGFNYNITSTTRNLLIYANVCGVPCLFSSLFLLFKFYSTLDLWTANGVHLVYRHEDVDEVSAGVGGEETTYSVVDQTTMLPDNSEYTSNQNEDEDYPVKEGLEVGSPGAESTLLSAEEGALKAEDESMDMGRKAGPASQSKVMFLRQRARLNERLRRSCLGDCVADVAIIDTRGSWVDVSDLPS